MAILKYLEEENSVFITQRLDQNDKVGGGLIYIREGVTLIHLKADLTYLDVELLFSKLTLRKKKWL